MSDYKPSSVTQEAIDLMISREKEGLHEYQTSMDRTDLSPSQWTEHAIEEALDEVQYLIRVKRFSQLLESAHTIMCGLQNGTSSPIHVRQWIKDYEKQFKDCTD